MRLPAFMVIGADDTFTPDVRDRCNVSGIPRSQRLLGWLRGHPRTVSALASAIPARSRHQLGKRPQNWNLMKPSMPPETRAGLAELCREDILRTHEMIRRDLSAWRSCNHSESGACVWMWSLPRCSCDGRCSSGSGLTRALSSSTSRTISSFRATARTRTWPPSRTSSSSTS